MSDTKTAQVYVSRQLQFYIQPYEREVCHALAKQDGVSVSSYLRRLIIQQGKERGLVTDDSAAVRS